MFLFIYLISCEQDNNRQENNFKTVLIENANFSAGTENFNFNDSVFVWNLKTNKSLHEFAHVCFFDSLLLGSINIKSDKNIKTFFISLNGGKGKEYNNFQNIIIINKKIKQISFLILETNNVEKQNLISETETKYSLFNFVGNNYKHRLTIKLNTSDTSLIKPFPLVVQDTAGKKNVKKRFLTNNRIVNSRHFNNKKVTQSILFTDDGKLSFFKKLESKTGNKLFVGNGSYKYINDSLVFVNMMLSNLAKAKTAKYKDTFIINDKYIKGGRLFSYIYSGISDSSFVNILDIDSSFVLSIRYATEDNFLKTKLYDCPNCFLRYIAAKDLVAAHKEAKQKGFRMKLYDCYRPHSVQVKMWNLMPVVGYVADPATGSRHNRGTAIDVSLIDSIGKEIEMGTKHDFFGKEAHTFYPYFSKKIRSNRLLLRKIMTNHNFSGINSEWWHFSHNVGHKYPVSDRRFDCH